MMTKNKILLLGLIITVALGGLTGCAGEITTTQPETTTPQVVTGQEETNSEEETTEKTTEENETDGGVMGYVDAEDICKHISINGKVVEFPWTLNELGDEYTFSDEPTIDLEEKEAGAYLLYNGEEVALIQAKIDEGLDRNSLIYYIIPYSTIEICVYNISNTSIEGDVIKRFGVPTSIMEDDYENRYIYSTNNVYMDFTFKPNTGEYISWNFLLKDEYLNKKAEGK